MTPRQTTLRFPELRLPPHEGHRLRGYFGTAFREHSPLLHNHLEDGSLRNGYPLTQYKMIDRVPTILGFNEAADVLIRIFADIAEIRIADQVLDARAKELTHDTIAPTFLPDTLVRYRLDAPYRGVSQEQYQQWKELDADEDRFVFMQRALVGHLLMVFKGLDVWLEDDQRIVAYPNFRTTLVRMKGYKMTAFTGDFITNVALPDYIGIGKGTSRGFGIIRRQPGRLAPAFPPAAVSRNTANTTSYAD